MDVWTAAIAPFEADFEPTARAAVAPAEGLCDDGTASAGDLVATGFAMDGLATEGFATAGFAAPALTATTLVAAGFAATSLAATAFAATDLDVTPFADTAFAATGAWTAVRPAVVGRVARSADAALAVAAPGFEDFIFPECDFVLPFTRPPNSSRAIAACRWPG